MKLEVMLYCFLFKFVAMENEVDFLDVKTKPSDNITVDHCFCVPFWLCKNITDISITKRTSIAPCRGRFDVCCQIECGRNNSNSFLSDVSHNDTQRYRILGDNLEAGYGEFPWMLGIIKNDVFVCGGSLIHPQVAITAAHCVLEDKKYVVRAGEWNWAHTSEPLPFQERLAKKIIVHTKYRSESLQNDIAIIILDTPFQLTGNVGIICLPSHPSKTSNTCLVTGWGKSTNVGSYQSRLKKIGMRIVSRERCSKILGIARLGSSFKLHTSFMCAGGNSKDTCKGDGGSPLMCPIQNHPNRYVQVGIVSWGLTCGVYRTPGVYVKVAMFTDWIDEWMKENNFNRYIYKILN